MVTVGESAPPGGGLNKHTLLIGALIIGGVAGAMVLFLKHKTPVTAGENTAQQPTDQSALGTAYQNLATQLLGLRGDLSVSNANLAGGEQDIMSAVGSESADRATSDAALVSQVSTVSDLIKSGGTDIGAQLAAIFGQGTQTQAQIDAGVNGILGQGVATQSEIAAYGNSIVGQNAQTQTQVGAGISSILGQGTATQRQVANESHEIRTEINTGFDPANALFYRDAQTAFENATNAGAGGMLPRQAILAAAGASQDDTGDYLRKMSSGPVRRISTRGY